MAARFVTIYLTLCLLLAACTPTPPIPPIENTATSTSIPPSKTASPTIQTPPPPALPTGPAEATAEPALTTQIDSEIDLQAYPPLRPFKVMFSKPMDPSSSAKALMVYPYMEGEVEWNPDLTEVTFSPQNGFEQKRPYTLFLDPDLSSKNGEKLSQTQIWNIQTSVGPWPSSIFLDDNGRTNLDPQIVLGFNRLMDRISVEEALTVDPPVDLEFSWSDNTVTISPVQPFRPGDSYAITIAKDAHDLNGTPMQQSFKIDYWLKSLSVTPNSPTSKVFELEFNYPLSREMTGVPFKVEPELLGTWAWLSSSLVAFTAEQPLKYGMEYHVSITGPLYDTSGIELTPSEKQFTIFGPSPIEDYSPQYDMEVDDSFLVTFAVKVDKPSAEQAFEIEPPVAGEFKWTGRNMKFTPSKPLTLGQVYKITIHNSLLSENGEQLLTDEFSWSVRVHTAYGHSFTFGEEGYNAQVVSSNGRRVVHYRQGDNPVKFKLYQIDPGQFAASYVQDFGYYRIDWYSGQNLTNIDTADFPLVAQWYEDRSQQAANGIAEAVIPSSVSPGVYVLEAVDSTGVQGSIFVNLTHTILVVKKSALEVLVWACDASTGAAVDDLEVRIFAEHGEKIAQGKTDEQGIFKMPVAVGYQPTLVTAIAENGDISISGIKGWRTNSYWWYDYPAQNVTTYQTYLYTERPLYQPGQTVYFKAIIRKDYDGSYTTPASGTSVTIRIHDSRDNIVQTFNLMTNSNGTVNGEFSIAEGAMLGTYQIEAVVSGESTNLPFEVQEYEKPDIVVDVKSDKEKYVVGETATFTITASYLFGEPVALADLNVQPYKAYSWYNDYGSLYQDYSGHENIAGGKKLKTNELGQVVFTWKIPHLTNGYYEDEDWQDNLKVYRVGLYVQVVESVKQGATGYLEFKAYTADESIKLVTEGFFKKPGDPFTIHAVIQDLYGTPIPQKDIKLVLHKMSETSWSYSDKVGTYDLVTDQDGNIQQPMTIEEPGVYKMVLSAKDSRSNTIQYNEWFYVFSEDDTWADRYSDSIDIQAEKTHYKPYETARFVIESSIGGPAMLMFERGRVIRTLPVTLTPPLTVVETTIIAADAPNVFVTIQVWDEINNHIDPTGDNWWSENIPDARLRMDRIEIQVDTSQQALQVSIDTDKDTYLPRGQATITVTVTTASGEPVSAEVSLAMVDEAIFQMKEEQSKPIFDSFYGRRAYSVATYDSMQPTRWMMSRDQGGGGGGGDDYASDPRSEFPDTAAWFPVLNTGSDGKVSVTVSLPDNLTTWRLTAKAVSSDTHVGETIYKFNTQQEAVLRPAFPTALTSGDRLHLVSFIHNYTNEARPFQVTLESESLQMISSATQNAFVLPGEKGLISWDVQALQTGSGWITVTATNEGQVMDAVRLPVMINALVIPNAYITRGSFDGSYSTSLVIPPDTLPSSGITIRLNPTIAGSLLEGLEYLTGYPYGCVEQTMSRALPNAVVGNILHQLGVNDPSLEAKLPELVNNGLQRLYGMQHPDGGWGWWYDDETSSYQTAWVVFGLAVTAHAGYEVDPKVIDRGVDILKEMMEPNDMDIMDPRIKAFALYAMSFAGKGDLNETLTLMDNVDMLDTFSLSALAITLNELGEKDRASEVLSILEKSVSVSSTASIKYAYWSTAIYDGEYNQKTMASSVRSTALALSAYTRIQPDSDLIPDIVNWLMDQRQANGWGTTNETAFTILALTDHLSLVQTDIQDVTFSITLDGATAFTGTLKNGSVASDLSKVITIPGSMLPTGEHTITITQSGVKNLYFTIVQKMDFRQDVLKSTGPVKVNRRYLDPKTNKPLESILPGQIVRVSLTVSLTTRASFVIIEDHLPGGLEAINDALNSGNYTSEYYNYNTWESFGYNKKEIHQDRVNFFITEMQAKSYTFTYLVRVTQTGEFTALPCEVYAMYDLGVWGRSESSMIITESMP